MSKIVSGKVLWLFDDEALVDWGTELEPSHIVIDPQDPSLYWVEMPHQKAGALDE